MRSIPVSYYRLYCTGTGRGQPEAQASGAVLAYYYICYFIQHAASSTISTGSARHIIPRFGSCSEPQHQARTGTSLGLELRQVPLQKRVQLLRGFHTLQLQLCKAHPAAMIPAWGPSCAPGGIAAGNDRYCLRQRQHCGSIPPASSSP